MSIAKPSRIKAGPTAGLPLLIVVVFVFQSRWATSVEPAVITFQKFRSTCIDLAHYDQNTRILTARFLGDSNRFYSYANVSEEAWRTIHALDQTGSVGRYLATNVIQHPEKFPVRKLAIGKFNTLERKFSAPSGTSAPNHCVP